MAVVHCFLWRNNAASQPPPATVVESVSRSRNCSRQSMSRPDRRRNPATCLLVAQVRRKPDPESSNHGRDRPGQFVERGRLRHQAATRHRVDRHLLDAQRAARLVASGSVFTFDSSSSNSSIWWKRSGTTPCPAQVVDERLRLEFLDSRASHDSAVIPWLISPGVFWGLWRDWLICQAHR